MPVPDTVAAHVDVCPVAMDAGDAETVIPVTVKEEDVTVMFAEPDMFVYPACAELAVHVAVPAPDGVNTPAGVIVPPVASQVTAELYAPVPDTVAAQVAVCAVVMEAGVARTATLVTVTVGGVAVTAIDADPATFVYPVCAEWAVQVPVPAPDGVKTPVGVMAPPVAVQVTAGL